MKQLSTRCNRYWLVISMIGVLLVGTPWLVGAASFRGGDSEDVIIDAPVADDLYAVGNEVEVKEDVAQDVMIVGQAVAVSSVIGEDLYTLGQFVSVAGVVEDDVHVAGNSVDIEGRVEGDVFVAGQSVTIAETAVITGDVFVAGQIVTVAGEVQGEVRAASEDFTVRSGANIGGDVRVYGQAPTIEDGASIAGSVTHREHPQPEVTPGSVVLLGWVQGVLGLFVVAMVLTWFLPALVKEVLDVARRQPGGSLLTGFVWMVISAPLALMLLFSVLGIPLAFATFFLTGLAFIAGSGIAALLVGQWLLRRLDTKQEDKQLLWPQALLGAAVYKAVQLLGPVGWLLSLALLVWGMGALGLTVWKKRGGGNTKQK